MEATVTTPAAFTAMLLWATILAVHAAADGGHGKPQVEANDLVARTCANATSDICRRLFTNDFCVSSLRLDNRSAAATHPRDLALVAMDLVKLSAVAANAKIDSVLRGKGAVDDKGMELDLQDCRLSNEALVRTVPVCRGLVEEYKPGGQGNLKDSYYFECVDMLVKAGGDCGLRIISPSKERKILGKEIDEVSNHAMLVKVMTEQMVGDTEDDEYPGLGRTL